MKSINLLLKGLALALLSPLASLAQAKVTWGDEFKMHTKTTDLEVVYADKSGIYLEESHHHTKIGFFGGTLQKESILVKLDNNMAEQYRNDFGKELDGKDYDRLFFIQGRLYIFSYDYSKKEKTERLYAAEIDKGSGQLKGTWKELCAWQKETKDETIDYNIAANEDSTRIIVTSTVSGKTQNRYEIKIMDADLKPLGKPLAITNEFDPKTFQVQDFVYTTTGNIILVGRVYDYEEGKKKKAKNLVFQHYNIRIYDPNGKVVQDLATDIDGRYLVTGKMKQVNKELVLAAFYSNAKKRKEINGLLVERIDPLTGKVLMTSKQEVTNGLVTEVDDEDDKDGNSKKKKDDDDDDGLDANLVFRNFYVAPDNGLVILAEKYRTWVTTSTSSSGSGFGGHTTVYRTYELGDIYMAKVSLQGNIDWLHVLPKKQTEVNYLYSGYNSGGFFMYGYFDPQDGHPWYCGFSTMAGKNSIHLFFNDHKSNSDILQPGKKLHRISAFNKSICYQVNLNMTTGKYDRTTLFNNNDIPVAMIRKGAVIGNTMYIAGMGHGGMFSKLKCGVGKIVSAD